MKTLLVALFLAFALASNMLGMCAGCIWVYTPPAVATPALSGEPTVVGGGLVQQAVQTVPQPWNQGFLLAGPMDVQAGAGISLTDILTLQYTVTATFQPTMDTQYWVDSYLGDFIWSNTYGTQAQLDSVTSETYIDPGDCGTSCDIADALAQGTTSLGPISIPYDPANSIAGAVNSYLLSAYWGTDSTQLYAADTYTLVHQTTFNISGLAPSEVIRIDLPEDSNLSGAAVLTHAPEPATWGLALLGIGLAGFRLRKRSR